MPEDKKTKADAALEAERAEAAKAVAAEEAKKPKPRGPGKDVAAWARAKATPAHVLEAARLAYGWPAGEPHGIDEGGYDDAITKLATPPKDGAKASVEHHWASTGLEPWKFRAVRAYHAWPVGHQLTADEFAAAVKSALDGATIH